MAHAASPHDLQVTRLDHAIAMPPSAERDTSPLLYRTGAHITSEQMPTVHEGPHDQSEDSAVDASKWRLSEQWAIRCDCRIELLLRARFLPDLAEYIF